MANQLSMAKINAIETLHQSGHSNRKIARLLGVDRGAVGKYVRQLECRTGHPGSSNAPTGGVAGSPHLPGPASDCEPLRQVIAAKLEQGLSAQRIFQDLRADHEFAGSYYSVRRFAARLRAKLPLPVRRLETEPGEEAQVDFDSGAPVIDEQGKRRRPWMFRIVLCHSRKGYSEVVWRQTTDNFIAALENAFQHFGGAPKRLVIDYVPRHIIDHYGPRRAAEVPEGVLQHAEELFGGLAKAGFAVALARVREHDSQDVRLAPLTVGHEDACAGPEIDLSLLARLTLHPPKRQRTRTSLPLQQPPHAVVADLLGSRLVTQVLMDSPRRESLRVLLEDELLPPRRLALRPDGRPLRGWQRRFCGCCGRLPPGRRIGPV